jgi:hypothetical protein
MSVTIDMDKALSEWHDPESDRKFILNEDDSYKELKYYTDEDKAVLARILQGQHIGLDQEGGDDDYEPIYVQSSSDVFLEQFLRTFTLIGGGILLLVIIGAGCTALFS